MIRVREDLIVQVKRDQMLTRRGKAEVEVFPGEIRQLVNASPMPWWMWSGIGYRESSRWLYSSTVRPMSRMILRRGEGEKQRAGRWSRCVIAPRL